MTSTFGSQRNTHDEHANTANTIERFREVAYTNSFSQSTTEMRTPSTDCKSTAYCTLPPSGGLLELTDGMSVMNGLREVDSLVLQEAAAVIDT